MWNKNWNFAHLYLRNSWRDLLQFWNVASPGHFFINFFPSVCTNKKTTPTRECILQSSWNLAHVQPKVNISTKFGAYKTKNNLVVISNNSLNKSWSTDPIRIGTWFSCTLTYINGCNKIPIPVKKIFIWYFNWLCQLSGSHHLNELFALH